jgi:hypothetical protein
MSKFLARLSLDKVKLTLTLKISKVRVQINSQFEEIMIKVKRGPEAKETACFPVTQAQQEYKINFEFTRSSSFYRAKNAGPFQAKEIEIQLMRGENGRFIKVGCVQIDLSKLIGLGPQERIFPFEQLIGVQ